MAQRIYWDYLEQQALAKAVAEGLYQAHFKTVPTVSDRANTPFLKPIVNAAQERVLRPERRKKDYNSLKAIVDKFWNQVPKHLEEMHKNGGVNGHEKKEEPKVVAPPAPPPPSPAEVIRSCTDEQVFIEFGTRLFKALATRQMVNVTIPAIDEIRKKLTEEAEITSRLVAEELSGMRTTVLKIKEQVDRLRPPPPHIVVLGANPEAQAFLRRKCDEASLDVDFRFIPIAENPKPFKADYVIMLGQVGSEWDRYIQAAVPKSHQVFVSGRPDQAMMSIKSWLA